MCSLSDFPKKASSNEEVLCLDKKSARFPANFRPPSKIIPTRSQIFFRLGENMRAEKYGFTLVLQFRDQLHQFFFAR